MTLDDNKESRKMMLVASSPHLNMIASATGISKNNFLSDATTRSTKQMEYINILNVPSTFPSTPPFLTLVADLNEKREVGTSIKKEENKSDEQNWNLNRLTFTGTVSSPLLVGLTTSEDGGDMDLICWDVQRGVRVKCGSATGNKHRRIPVDISSSLSSRGNSSKSKIENTSNTGEVYLLEKDLTAGKLLVSVHNFGGDTVTGKAIRHLKVGNIDDESIMAMDVKSTMSRTMVAVMWGKKVRIMDGATAEVIGKVSLKKNHSVETNRQIVLSSDGRAVAISSPDALVLYAPKEDNKKWEMITSIDLRKHNISNSDDEVISVDISDPVDEINGSRLIVSWDSDGATASIYSSSSSDTDVLTKIKAGKGGKIVHVSFTTVTTPNLNHSQSPRLLRIVEVGNSGASPQHPKGVEVVRVSEIKYLNNKMKMDKSIRLPSLCDGQIDNDNKNGESIDEAEDEMNMKKRRRVDVVTMGPGEGGLEEANVKDLTTSITPKKKIKTDESSEYDDEEEDDDQKDEFHFETEDEEDAEEGEGGDSSEKKIMKMTIAERLATLSSNLAQDQDDDWEPPRMPLIKNETSSSVDDGASHNIHRATADSVSILLRQAIESNDDAQLEEALRVTDFNVILNSVRALANPDDNDNERDDSAGIDSDEDIGDSDNGIIKTGKRGKNGEVVDKIRKVSSKAEDEAVSRIMTLLAKVAYRLPRRPARGVELAQWIRAVLTIVVEFCDSDRGKGGNNKQIGRDVADRLGPIRNLLGERLETMPALLKLEGRLGLLTWAGMSS